MFRLERTARPLFLAALVAAIASLSVRPAWSQISRGRILILRCASCHDISSTASPKIGPNLSGVVGRRAGGLAGYSYSPAMKAQTFVWDDSHLDRWLTKPNDLVPGTAMAFGGLPDKADRDAVIAYLRKPTP